MSRVISIGIGKTFGQKSFLRSRKTRLNVYKVIQSLNNIFHKQVHFNKEDFEWYVAKKLKNDAIPISRTIEETELLGTRSFQNFLCMEEDVFSNVLRENDELKLKLVQYEVFIQEKNLLNIFLEQRVERVQIRNENLQTKLNVYGKFGFNSDQLTNKNRLRNGKRWRPETVEEALVIRFACGTSGYETLLKLNYALPSIKTLNRKISHIQFSPGILHEILHYLKIKIQNFSDCKKDCCLFLDETVIEPGEQYCVATCTNMGRETLEKGTEIATHVLAVMLGGVSSGWKQLISYHFTWDKMKGESLAKHLLEIINICSSIGFNIVNVTTDMGPSNQAMWKYFGLKSKKTKLQNFIVNPYDESKKIYFMADVSHLFKNIRSSLLNNKKFIIPNHFVEKFHLPSNIVNYDNLKNLADIQENWDLKLTPKLTSDVLNLNHFNKMKVSLATHVLNSHVSSALKFLSIEKQSLPEYQQNLFDENATTTAWFIETVSKWKEIMASRNETSAISKIKREEYDSTIEFLHDVLFLFKNIKIGEKGYWKPIQTGVILSTQTMLNLQDYFLNVQNYTFLLTSRFSQDRLENLFSQMRIRQPVPNALQVRNLLKNLCVIQYIQIELKGNSYTTIYDHNLLGLNDLLHENETDGLNKIILKLPVGWNATDTFLGKISQNCLYYCSGYILRRIYRNSKCRICHKTLFTNKIDRHFSKLTVLRENKKQNHLLYPKETVFELFILMEKLFVNLTNALSQSLTNKSKLDLRNLYLEEMRKSTKIKNILLIHHNLKEKILKLFSLFRIRIYFKNRTKQIKRQILKTRGEDKSSKSKGMRDKIENDRI